MQPVILASLLGIFVSSITPLRNVLVPVYFSPAEETSPLQWLFTALYDFGDAAVPVNMILLGATISDMPSARELVSRDTLAAAVGKMILMPVRAQREDATILPKGCLSGGATDSCVGTVVWLKL